MRILLAVILAFTLGIGTVSADVSLKGDIGAATIRVDGEVTSVTYEGTAVFANHDGYALVSVFDATSHDSLVIHGDFLSYEVQVAVDSQANDIELSTQSGQIDNQSVDDSGTDISSMNLEKDIQDYHETYGWLNDIPF